MKRGENPIQAYICDDSLRIITQLSYRVTRFCSCHRVSVCFNLLAKEQQQQYFAIIHRSSSVLFVYDFAVACSTLTDRALRMYMNGKRLVLPGYFLALSIYLSTFLLHLSRVFPETYAHIDAMLIQ